MRIAGFLPVLGVVEMQGTYLVLVMKKVGHRLIAYPGRKECDDLCRAGWSGFPASQNSSVPLVGQWTASYTRNEWEDGAREEVGI